MSVQTLLTKSIKTIRITLSAERTKTTSVKPEQSKEQDLIFQQHIALSHL
jgi:hypothetical protein